VTTGFVKIYGEILTSTVWGESLETRVVWISMLALADAEGYVAASIPGLARVSNVSLEQCEHAIERLLAADKHSRTREHEGRRIEAIDGGWRILNHRKYRDRRGASGDRMAAKRTRDAANIRPSHGDDVTAEAEAEADQDRREGESTRERMRTLPLGNVPEDFVEHLVAEVNRARRELCEPPLPPLTLGMRKAIADLWRSEKPTREACTCVVDRLLAETRSKPASAKWLTLGHIAKASNFQRYLEMGAGGDRSRGRYTRPPAVIDDTPTSAAEGELWLGTANAASGSEGAAHEAVRAMRRDLARPAGHDPSEAPVSSELAAAATLRFAPTNDTDSADARAPSAPH
jgi:hypothetical protein